MWSPLMLTMELFDLFSSKPENKPKCSICFIAFFKDFVSLTKIVASSANCSIFISTESKRVIPVMSRSFLILIASTSTASMKSRAERGHPWRTPLVMLICSVNQPFTLTLLLTFVYRVLTHLQKSFLNPNFRKHSKRKSQLRQSNAFLKSVKNASPLSEWFWT